MLTNRESPVPAPRARPKLGTVVRSVYQVVGVHLDRRVICVAPRPHYGLPGTGRQFGRSAELRTTQKVVVYGRSS